MSVCRYMFICIMYTYIPIYTHKYIGVYIQYVYMYNIYTHIQHTSIYTHIHYVYMHT